jgi:hypothetical protein
MSIELSAVRMTVIMDVISKAMEGGSVIATPDDRKNLATTILERLEVLDLTLINPPGHPPLVPAYGDPRSKKVVEALLAKPEVLYGVLGILHNYEIAGPWEHHSGQPGDPGVGWSWVRIDARRGGDLATICPRQTGFQCLINIHDESVMAMGAEDLPAAMATVDAFLAIQKGWVLVPGWKQA